jgi:hypothetical protein
MNWPPINPGLYPKLFYYFGSQSQTLGDKKKVRTWIRGVTDTAETASAM